MNIVRSILGIIGGWIVGGIITGLGLMIVYYLYPPAAGIDPTVNEQFKLYVSTWPVSAFLILLVSYFLGVFFAAFAAAKVAGRAELLHGFIISLIFSFFAFLHFANVPHPTWVMTAAFLVYFAAGFAGSGFAGNLRGAQSPA